MISKFEAENIIRAAAGGKSPAHGDSWVFDKDAGWLFTPAAYVVADLEEMAIPAEFTEVLEIEDPTTISLPDLAAFVAALTKRLKRISDEQV